ncbi:MAG: hypothetical protein JXM70_07945 [Pirellulales bacterium]|nr:hypothetical protein [Pirellulales bacterium]
MPELLYPEEIDKRFNWPLGRSARLARQRRLPHVLLPDGSIRFDWNEIEPFVVRIPTCVNPKEVSQ